MMVLYSVKYYRPVQIQMTVGRHKSPFFPSIMDSTVILSDFIRAAAYLAVIGIKIKKRAHAAFNQRYSAVSTERGFNGAFLSHGVNTVQLPPRGRRCVEATLCFTPTSRPPSM